MVIIEIVLYLEVDCDYFVGVVINLWGYVEKEVLVILFYEYILVVFLMVGWFVLYINVFF